MRWKPWTSFFVVSLTIGSVLAQDAAPPPSPAVDARVVRVRIVHTGGMCGGFGYCTSITTIEPSFILSEHKDSSNKEELPDTKTRRAITKQEWENLQRTIDVKSLMALPQPKGCRACIDLPDSWVGVEFSDGTKISVSYDPMNSPAPVAALLQEIPTLQIILFGGHRAAAPAPKETYQQARPARVVSIRFSTFGGTCECCSGGNELQVRPGGATLLITFSRDCHQRDSHKYRDLRVDADLSSKHWQALQRLIDHDALFALPDTIGCASCVDGIDELIEVKFSDHNKKSVTFPMGSAPKEISALSEKLLSLEAK